MADDKAKEEAAAKAKAEADAAEDAKVRAEIDAKAKALAEEEAAAKAKADADAAAALKAIDPKKRETHPAVMAIPGHSCSVEGCDFIFGDKQYGVEPHPIQPIIVKAWPTVGPPEPPPPPPAAPSDPAVCQNAIQVGNDCPACGWKQNSAEPHPIRL